MSTTSASTSQWPASNMGFDFSAERLTEHLQYQEELQARASALAEACLAENLLDHTFSTEEIEGDSLYNRPKTHEYWKNSYIEVLEYPPNLETGLIRLELSQYVGGEQDVLVTSVPAKLLTEPDLSEVMAQRRTRRDEQLKQFVQNRKQMESQKDDQEFEELAKRIRAYYSRRRATTN